MKMRWIKLKDKSFDIPINTDLLISDGSEVFVGFLDSMLEWRMKDQELCEDIDFHISHWMEFPYPPM